MPPSVNHYTQSRAIIKNGRPLSIVYKTKESVAYQEKFKQYVADEVIAQNWDTNLESPKHFYIDAVFYMDQKRKDCNNLWKCLLDAITETQLIWKDDDIVCERVNRILYDLENPRVELHVYYVDYVGIFDTEDQLSDFVSSNCIDCKRYKRNCSILRKAMEGRVQEETNGITCAKFSPVKSNNGDTSDSAQG